jgi:hypothetical protein
MIINFKEIPEAHKGGGLQDTWELFCREFFISQNYEIIDEPARGADGGLDIKVKAKANEITWLVSCKHKAHSNTAIGSKDEINIRDRVESQGCDGFIGFYSTIPSSGLKNTLTGLSHKMPFEIFDREKIERAIVGFHSQEKLFIRFFPESFKSFKDTYFYREPVKLFLTYVKSQYEDFISTYQLIFNSVENILPYLRKGISFEEALNEQNITILSIEGIDKTFDWSYQFKHSGISKDYSMMTLANELLPNEAKYLYGIEIFSHFNQYCRHHRLGLYVIYPNYIICSPQFITVNNLIFQQLQEVLI